MTYAAKSILWIIGGPIASTALGFATFLFLVFAMGVGFDIDDVGSPREDFFMRLALPALGIVAIGGSIFSVVVGVRYAFAHRALVAEGYPCPINEINRQNNEG